MKYFPVALVVVWAALFAGLTAGVAAASSGNSTVLRKSSIASGFSLWNTNQTFAVGIQPDGVAKKNSSKLRTKLKVEPVSSADRFATPLTMIGDAHRYKVGKGKARKVIMRKKAWLTLSYPQEYNGYDKTIRYWNSAQKKWKRVKTSDNRDSNRVTGALKHKSAVVAVFLKPQTYTNIGSGQASWYDGTGAAHNQAPIGSTIRVTNLANGKSVEAIVAGRGPFIPGRVVDLSREDFAAIANLSTGVISVKVEQVD